MTTAAAVPERPRMSLEALQESRPARAILGVLLAAIVAGVAYLIVLLFTGTFTNVARISAQLPAGSNAVAIDAPVQYRDVTVGKVGSETQGPGGRVAVEFEVYPQYLHVIPAGVTAQVEPLSIFGNQYVNLVPPANIAADATHLEAGQFVGPYGGTASTSLQGTVTQLYDLLNAVHPAELDTALTAFAQALNGEGTTLRQALADTSDYSGTVAANLPQLESGIQQLTPFGQTLEASTPNILSTLSNTSVTAGTLTSEAQELHGLLTNGTNSIGRFADILQNVQTSLPALANDSGPLLEDVSANPNELSQTLTGLTTFVDAVVANEQQGPYLSVSANLPVADISAGVDAALGYNNPASIHQSLGSLIDPATYTSANCPQYAGETNVNCGAAGSNPDAAPLNSASLRTAPASTADTAATETAATSPQGSTPTPAEMDAVDSIAAALSGGRQAAAPGFDEVVLLPLLLSVTGQQ